MRLSSNNQSGQVPKGLLIFALLLLIPAFFWNVNRPVLIEDEAIRGLVAQEMCLSGNYITPTLNSEFYYKKPPLFNWMVALSYQLSGEVNEFSVRLPSILALFFFSFLVYWIGKLYLDREVAILSALAMLTNGRILVYDSLLGLIDISFSMVIFLLFFSIYHFFNRRRWLELFVMSYVLMSIAFMFKGLPAIVFQGISLLAWFVYKGEFKKLFCWQHVVGVISSLLLLGTYLYLYSGYQSISELATVIFSESSKATAIEQSMSKTISHLFSFPFEIIYHFLPWTLFALFFIRKGSLRSIKDNEFLLFGLFIVLVNIWIYWISPRVYPRYLFMFLPFVFYAVMNAFALGRMQNDKLVKYIETGLGVIISLITLVIPFAFFEEDLRRVQHSTLMIILAFVSLIVVVCLYWYKKQSRLLVLVIFLLVGRLIFDGLVIPERQIDKDRVVMRDITRKVGLRYADESLAIIGKEDTYDTYSYYTNSFYLSEKRKEAIYRVDRNEIKHDQLYILDPFLDDKSNYLLLDSFPIRHLNTPFYIVKMK